MKFASRLNRIADFAVHPECRNDELEHSRARILSAFLAISLIFLILVNIFMIFTRSIPTGHFSRAHPALGMASLSYVALLFLLKRTKNLISFGHWVLRIQFLSMTGFIVVSGGNDSPLLPLYAVIIVLSFLFTGMSGGFVWTFIAITCHQVISRIDPQLWTELNSLNPTFDPAFDRLTTVLLYSLIFFASISYYLVTHQLISNIRQERQEYRIGAEQDELTGLGNRRSFETLLAKYADSARHNQGSFALLYLDLDKFKPVNDSYGHEAGDIVLRIVAERILGKIRSDDRAFRLGGDEFAVIFQGVREKSQITSAALHTLEVIRQPIDIGQTSVRIDCSGGAALFPSGSDDIDELVRIADKAMYCAKASSGALEIA
jgi:diguanylate cyclase (GGDEF)-like protein